MKISLLFILLTFFYTTLQAEDQLFETKEIIGSGIFEVNKTRSFSLDTDSVIYLDDKVIDPVLFEIIGSGFKSAFTLRDDVNSTIDSGTINAIELITNLRGPVTSIAPLMILEQPVLITSDTYMALQGDVAIGDSVGISGYLSTNNSLKATRMMPNESLASWKIRGFADKINSNNFRIGTLVINLGGEQILNCDNGFNLNELIEVKMAADLNYQAGTAIETIESIECLKINQLLNDITSTLPSVVQGFISQTQGQDFWLDDIKVNVTNNTDYENGERGFIDEAVNVEVQGTLDVETSILTADVVRFIDHRIEITFPIEPQDIVIDESVAINGITFMKTPQSKDGANILSGIDEAMQIQIQGYIDTNGAAYISKILDKGPVDFEEISLRGDISALDNPLFSILNFQIDSSSSLIINLGSGVIDVATFFSLVEVGSQVEVKNAQYDPISTQLTNALITIKKIVLTRKSSVSTKEIIGSGIFSGFGTATISATADQLFLSGFE